MKAWVLHDVGDIRLEEVKKPLPQKGEVLIKVKAAGICGSDFPRIYETGAHNMPLIPGHEFSGIVESVGDDEDRKWIGKKVAVCPKIPCGTCTECKKGNLNSCINYDYIGSRRNGAFAEFVKVPGSSLLEIPEEVSFEAAAMMEPLAVAVNAIRTGIMGNYNLSQDSPIAVWGLGTIGLMVVRFLQDAGHHNIYVIGKREGQKKRALSSGIPEDHYIDSDSKDISERLRECSGGISLMFECVGRNECLIGGIDSLAPKGMLVLVGNPYTDMDLPKDIYWKILRKQLTIKGIWNSAFFEEKTIYGPINDWNYALLRLSERIICPEDFITHRYPIEELDSGFNIMKDKREDYFKIMMAQ